MRRRQMFAMKATERAALEKEIWCASPGLRGDEPIAVVDIGFGPQVMSERQVKVATAIIKNKGGRPKGSKNRPKT